MKAVVLLSGGLDSAVLLDHVLREAQACAALSVNYGQRHRKEIVAASHLARHYRVRHEVADLTACAALFAGSALTGTGDVPHGHYESAGMKATVVPNRNMVLIALAGALAASLKYDVVAYAAHSGDHTIYPDCRPAFTEAMDTALGLCDWHPLCLYRPFVGVSKAHLVKTGAAQGVPFALTWTCYEGGAVQCGRCGACVERREAFARAEVTDPTEYVA